MGKKTVHCLSDKKQTNNTGVCLCNEPQPGLRKQGIRAIRQPLKGRTAEPSTGLFGAVLIFQSIFKFCLGALCEVHLEERYAVGDGKVDRVVEKDTNTKVWT